MATSQEASATTPASDARPVICVFCGASNGSSPAYLAAAEALAHALHAANARLVYGGGTVGLMGRVASTLVRLSGADAVHGVIPRALVEHEAPEGTAGRARTDAEVAASIDARVYGRTTVVADMHARKKAMAALVGGGAPGSGFVALPGGYGTLEELMEMTTWNQLGIHALPVVLLNVAGYWDGLVAWMRGAVGAGFISAANVEIIQVVEGAQEAVAALKAYRLSEGRYRLDWGQA